jgi:parvulin-like peptidyl-prolyl isomerase
VSAAVAVVVATLVAASAGGDDARAARDVVDRIVAVVDHDAILASEVDALVDPALGNAARDRNRADAVDDLIVERLLDHEIARLHLDDGTGVANARARLIRLKVASRVTLNDAGVASALRSRPDVKIRAQHFSIARDDAWDLESARRMLSKGDAFSDVALALSDGSTRNAADTGLIVRGELLPEVEEPLFAAAVGDVVGPVALPDGFHFFLVQQRFVLMPAASDVRATLFNAVLQEQFRAYVDELKTAAHIEKRL